MALLKIVQFFMSISILVTASRQSWTFSRDGALPFSKFFRIISIRMGYISVQTTLSCAFAGAVLGLLCLITPAAAAEFYSLAGAGSIGYTDLYTFHLGRAEVQARTILHCASE